MRGRTAAVHSGDRVTLGSPSASPTCLSAEAREPTTKPALEEARKQGSGVTRAFSTCLLILLCAGSSQALPRQPDS